MIGAKKEVPLKTTMVCTHVLAGSPMTNTKTISSAERRELEERIIWELGPSTMCVGKLSTQLGVLPEVVSSVVDGLVECRLIVRESGDAEPTVANPFKRVYRLSSHALSFLRRGKDPTDPNRHVAKQAATDD